jgi:hypothetical protein
LRNEFSGGAAVIPPFRAGAACLLDCDVVLGSCRHCDADRHPLGEPAIGGFHATQASVSKTCLVRFDNNKYSVATRAVGRPAEIQAYADRIVTRQDGAIVGEHRRRFGRGETIYDPWHYVPVLARKPGALRNGAPFKDWPLAASLGLVRHKPPS